MVLVGEGVLCWLDRYSTAVDTSSEREQASVDDESAPQAVDA